MCHDGSRLTSRVLIASAPDRVTSLTAALGRDPRLHVLTTDDVPDAMRRLTAERFALVVVDLEIRGCFLLLDAIQAMRPRRRPLVFALRSSPEDRAVLDPDIVTIVISRRMEPELPAFLISLLAESQSASWRAALDDSGSHPLNARV